MGLQHPLVPHVLDRFAEGKYYYMVQEYITGESLAEKLQKQLGPLSEDDVIIYMHHLLNILMALERQNPPLYHFDISPTNIIIDTSRRDERAFLTGFQIPPPPPIAGMPPHTTRSIPNSPYLPPKDTSTSYDQRTSIYMLAATMHHALTNYAPEVYPAIKPPLPVHMFSPWVMPTLAAILYYALQENPAQRYQSYQEMQREVKKLL